MNTVIIIPVYKQILTLFEEKSFIQALKLFLDYHIVLVTHVYLDTNNYLTISNNLNVGVQIKYFEKSYFDSLEGYNQLCLNPLFYTTFAEYDYMLIYQLDAYVFSNQLEKWCSKGYDYIGAPWFEDNKSHEQGAQLWAVGNGGFSLRKISTFIHLFESKSNAYNFKYLFKKTIRERKGVIWLMKSYFGGFENNFNYLLNSWDDAEDLFYCIKLADTNYCLNIPEIKISIDFAFEKSPEYLFRINGNKLPFGCHACEKYEYESFWKNHL